MENELFDRETAYSSLSAEEKQYFSKIFEIEEKLGGYVYRNHPMLSLEYYMLRYKNEGLDFSKYLKDTEAEKFLLEKNYSDITGNLSNKSNSMQRFNEKRKEERLHERKVNSKKNILFAIVLLFILFLMIYMLK